MSRSASGAETPSVDLPDDPRLLEAAQEFLGQLMAGQHPDRREFIRRYPDLAEPLNQCLEGLELIHRGTAPKHESVPSDAASPLDALPSSTLGDFQILREIGRGGMGVVYEAMQLSLRRRVALKVLPFAAAFDAKRLQRFHQEAQAAAQLHHSNIVPVYAVGCERGVHFYAMQLIEGQSLAAIIAELRHQAGRHEPVGPSIRGDAALRAPHDEPTGSYPSLTPAADAAAGLETMCGVSMTLSTQRSDRGLEFFRTAARFIVQAADAVEHAHQFGIVHRDIKPANLLIDVYGRIWVTDFGLAQFHADADLTQTGDLVGTLRYMSPEQASGQRVLIDQRTDVYALGATLYELATLEPVFPGQTRDELWRQILHHEPRPPRSMEKRLPVELETIILKAISKSPSDRYGSAREFAADLQRFLDDKPILARRPSVVDRARKWMRRHPAIVGTSVMLLVFSVVGLSVATALIAREQARTKLAYREERTRAEEAEQRFQLARRSADEMIRIADEELSDALHDVRQQRLRRRLLAAALAYYQEFIDLRRDDPAAKQELEATRDRVSKILADLAIMQGAFRHLLLGEPSVQVDLALKPGQIERIDEILRHIRKEDPDRARAPRQLDNEERLQRLIDEMRMHEEKIGAILTAPQLTRLRQIALQLQGPGAFEDPDVIVALKLTPDQRDEIRRLEREAFAMHREFGPPKGRRVELMPEPLARSQPAPMVDLMKRAESVLTPEQARAWKALTGEPLNGPMPLFFFGPRALGPPPPPQR